MQVVADCSCRQEVEGHDRGHKRSPGSGILAGSEPAEKVNVAEGFGPLAQRRVGERGPLRERQVRTYP